MLTKVCVVKAMVFPVVMYRCESWTVKKAEHLRIDAFKLWCWRRLLRVPWTTRKFEPINPKEYQSWISIWRIYAEAEAQYFGHLMWKSWLIGKDPDAGKDWKQEQKRMTEDEIIWWHHWLHEHEFEEAPGLGDGHGSLLCFSPWSHKKSDTTGWLNNK